MDIKRGDIVYVEIPYATVHEMMKDRPAVVVSNDAMNYTAPVVSVVYLTGSKQADRPFHVEVWGAASARHGSSTALCEHIYTVDKSRLGKLMGTCSEEEMDAIDKGILLSLALGDGKYRAGQGIQVPPPAPEARVEDERDIDADLLRAELRAADATISSTKAELETYKRLYGELLDRVVGGAA